MNHYKPLLVSTPLIPKIKEDIKTVTRRTVGLQEINKNPDRWFFNMVYNTSKTHLSADFLLDKCSSKLIKCPYGTIGTILWVRESFQEIGYTSDTDTEFFYKSDFLYNDDTPIDPGFKWQPSIHMPKKACRLFLQITNIGIERLQDITEKQAVAEGVNKWFLALEKEDLYQDYLDVSNHHNNALDSFKSLWQSINGLDSWANNPYVWVVEFKKIPRPVDFLPNNIN